MKTTTISVTLSESMQAFVDQKIAQWNFPSPSACVESILENALNRDAEDELERLLLEGVEGEGTKLTPEWWEDFRADLVQRHGGNNGQ